MTIGELLIEAKKQLTLGSNISCKSNVDTPALDAALLAGFVLQKTRVQLILNENKILSDDEVCTIFKLIERRLAGECVAYILGGKEFRGLLFEVNPSVLVPRADTETLVEAALQYIDFKKSCSDENNACKQISVLDLCTGSGAVAVSLKNERPFISVLATDISSEALATARRNSKRLLKDISCNEKETVRFLQSDLFENIDKNTEGTFDIIVSNPPYIPSKELAALAPEVQREPQIALAGGEDGLELIRRITRIAGKHLLPSGVLLLEAAPLQMSAIRKMLLENGFTEIKTFKDLAGRERVIAGVQWQCD